MKLTPQETARLIVKAIDSVYLTDAAKRMIASLIDVLDDGGMALEHADEDDPDVEKIVELYDALVDEAGKVFEIVNQ